MKNIKALFFAALITLSLTACNNTATDFISDSEAKKAITSYNPEAIITECTLHSDSGMYEIEFKTSHNVYTGFVNARTGDVDSVSVKEEIIPEDNSVFEPESPEDESFLATDTALAIAISDSKVSGSVVLVKNELNRENKTFTCVFRAGNREFTYIIHAITGDIISSETEIDS